MLLKFSTKTEGQYLIMSTGKTSNNFELRKCCKIFDDLRNLVLKRFICSKKNDLFLNLKIF